MIKEQDLLEVILSEVPASPKQKKTWLEITRQPHYENVISNIYAFFLDKDEDHKLKDLFLSSLLEIVKDKTGKEISFEDYSVYTEVSTENNGRIDILIEENDESSAIIIENKIYHQLLNDLDDYWISIKAPKENKVGILLTLNELEPTHNSFINLTHQNFIKQIRKNIGKFLLGSDDRYNIYLKDFFTNISNITSSNTKNMDAIKFYHQHRTKIDELLELKEQAKKNFLDEIDIAAQKLNTSIDGLKNKSSKTILSPQSDKIGYWIEWYEPEPEESETLFIQLYIKDENQPLIEKLMMADDIKKEAKTKDITIEYELWKKTSFVAWKNYSPTPEKFADFSSFIQETIENDWRKLTDKIIKKY